jgi:glycosyltransferase involved in cell wall biosynthesis
VIAYRRGSMPELLKDGVTGFLVSDVESAVAAVHRLPELGRAACRADAAARFSSDRMVADYEDLFQRLIPG